jgi:hypothetical protein
MHFRVLLIFLGVCLSSGCKEDYSYDLVKMQKLEDLSDSSSVRVVPKATTLKRKLGATIKNGAPYAFDACFDNERGELPSLEKVELVKLFEGKEIPVSYQVGNIGDWIDRGAFSCVHDIASFDSEIEAISVYCLNLHIRVADGVQIDRVCWQFERVSGEGEMTFQDILNQ